GVERFVRRPRRAGCFHLFLHFLFFGVRFPGIRFVPGPLENCGGASIISMLHIFSFSCLLNTSYKTQLATGLFDLPRSIVGTRPPSMGGSPYSIQIEPLPFSPNV